MMLTPENFRKGFLIDEELMAGVSELDDPQGDRFLAFVLRHTTGESLGSQPFDRLDDALEAINRIPRAWTYESSSGCGGGNCGAGTACGDASGCGQGGSCPVNEGESCPTGKA